MKADIASLHIALRESYLKAEEKLYQETGGSFRKIKDWDERGPDVIWEGIVKCDTLTRPYKIQIQYGLDYPFSRPKVFPVEPRIENQRHQNPTDTDSCLPGDLCLFPHAPDYWHVGVTGEEILRRALKWLLKYETNTLDDEIAPPEIESYFPPLKHKKTPYIILAESLLKAPGENSGSCLLVPTKSEKYAFLSLLSKNHNDDRAIEEIFRLSNLMLPHDMLNKDKMEIGSWFHITKEPQLPIPSDVADLMSLVANGKKVASIIENLALKRPAFLAVGYPVQFANIHWLVFQTVFAPYPSRNGFRPQYFFKKILASNRKNPIMIYDTQHVNVETIFKRVSGFNVEVLLKKSCTILGCGSIGSRVAESIVKSGVGTLILVDKDVLKVGNVARHVLGLNYLGQNKAEAMREFLLKKNPFAKIMALSIDVVNGTDILTEILSKSDVIISCLGNDSAEFLVNLASVNLQKPVLFCRTYMRGLLGEMLWASGPSEACFQCAAEYLQATDCAIPRPPEVPYEELVRFDADCGSAFIPASGIDLDMVALHCTRQALLFLQGSSIDANYWLLRGREPSMEENLTVPDSIREPFRQHRYQIPQNLNCQVCSK